MNRAQACVEGRSGKIGERVGRHCIKRGRRRIGRTVLQQYAIGALLQRCGSICDLMSRSLWKAHLRKASILGRVALKAASDFSDGKLAVVRKEKLEFGPSAVAIKNWKIAVRNRWEDPGGVTDATPDLQRSCRKQIFPRAQTAASVTGRHFWSAVHRRERWRLIQY